MLFRNRAAKQDCTAASLPSTRAAVFADVVRLQSFKLVLCGLVTLTASLPFLLFTLLQDGWQLSLYQQVQAGEMTAEMAALYQINMTRLIALLKIPAFLLMGIALAGVGRAIKLLAWEEPVMFWPDLRQGIRQNIRQMSALAGGIGLIGFLEAYVAGQGIQWLSYLAVFLPGPIAAYLSVCICVYDLPLRQQMQYALLLFSKHPVKTWVAFAAGLAPFLLKQIPNPYIHIAVGLLLGLLIPFIMLGWFCFAFGQMDVVINPVRYPQLLHRGLALNCEETDNGTA